MQVNQSGISGAYAAQSGNIAATKNIEDSAQADKVDSYTVQTDTVTISQAALDAAASDTETQGNGSGTEPPLVGTDGNGSGTEPPLVETQGNGSGTEPPKAN
ncbi:hypothetical protein [Shewanella cutis]|uniref:Uncharacterized protein n=1 Tax=Shewanella cutis TaxID=2766780 RepID=A0ABS9QW47_9GAMM|nr:hypothetical protein [Shewanella sp. PS-2]MCG9964593.1 hypothetical protein [Shewanella sp. PS-2]